MKAEEAIMINCPDKCPYCGGDESRCDFDWNTDRCSQMDSRNPAPLALSDLEIAALCGGRNAASLLRRSRR